MNEEATRMDLSPSPVQVEARNHFEHIMLHGRGRRKDRLRQACRAVQRYTPEVRAWLAGDDPDLRAMMGLGERPAQRRLL